MQIKQTSFRSKWAHFSGEIALPGGKGEEGTRAGHGLKCQHFGGKLLNSWRELVATHVPPDFGKHEFRIHLITVPKAEQSFQGAPSN